MAVFGMSSQAEVETVNAYLFYDAVEARENSALATGDAHFYPRGYGDDGLEFCAFRNDPQGDHAHQGDHAQASCELASAALESAAVAEVRATANKTYAALRAGCQTPSDCSISFFQLANHTQESYA